jgi:hypothetical protein
MVPIGSGKKWDVSAEIERLIVAKFDATSEDAAQRLIVLNANQGELRVPRATVKFPEVTQ